MQVKCLVTRVDELESDGVLFDSVRDAYTHILERSNLDGRIKEDYLISSVEVADPSDGNMSASMIGQGGL